MAREVAAILGHKLVDPVKPDLLPAPPAAYGLRSKIWTVPRYKRARV